MRSADRLALLALSALWGGGFLFVRIAVPEFGPFALVATRVLLAGLLMLVAIARTKMRMASTDALTATMLTPVSFPERRRCAMASPMTA